MMMMMTKLKRNITYFQVSDWMTEADLNQDGVLSYAEFKLSLYRVVEHPEVQKSYQQVGCMSGFFPIYSSFMRNLKREIN